MEYQKICIRQKTTPMREWGLVGTTGGMNSSTAIPLDRGL